MAIEAKLGVQVEKHIHQRTRGQPKINLKDVKAKYLSKRRKTYTSDADHP